MGCWWQNITYYFTATFFISEKMTLYNNDKYYSKYIHQGHSVLLPSVASCA